VRFEEGQADLRPGSLLALFSDGLPETMDGDGRAFHDGVRNSAHFDRRIRTYSESAQDSGRYPFHQRRLVEALRAGWGEPAMSVLERLLRNAEAFRGHREPTDNVSVILLRRMG
jgi:serine phosphatase RsbU (regulator of sigma subunit)